MARRGEALHKKEASGQRSEGGEGEGAGRSENSTLRTLEFKQL